ncbi:MAG: NAD-dependent epimerase/dehydratase family protein, partial [Bacteroidota bacterium]
DITNLVDVLEAVRGINYVFHCAGKVSFLPNDADYMHSVNVNGTANIVNACLTHQVSGICHVSSISALGRSSSGLYDEFSEWSESEYNSRYAISKYAAEMEVWRGIEEGLQAVIVNPGIIIGPGDWVNDSSAIFSKVDSGLRFFTDGINGFVSVEDVTNAMIQLMENRIHGERFVLVGDNIPFKEVMEIISEELGVAKADIAAGPWLSAFAWRVDKIRSKISGTRPLITKETARSAQSKSVYSNKKIMGVLSGSMSDPRPSIRRTAQVYKKAKSGS